MKIVFQGDSITDGLRNRGNRNGTNALGAGYPFITASILGMKYPEKDIEFVNAGIDGNRITDLLARWRRDTIRENPDILTIYIGINDIWHEYIDGNGVPSDLFESVYRLLLDACFESDRNMKIILIAPYCLPFGSVQKGWDVQCRERVNIVDRVAYDYNGVVSVIHTQEIFDEACTRAPMEHWCLDGVHPSPAGHGLIAQALVKEIEKLI